MNETPDIWTSLEAERLASAVYDPFSDMSLQEMTGGYARHFPAEAFVEPDWLTTVWQPWEDFGANLWETGIESVGYTYERLPELLWERGLQEILPRQQVVSEGAGVTVIHTQQPQPGGAPAQPIQKIIPGFVPRTPVAAPPREKVSSSMLIIVGVIIFIILIKK